MKTPLTIRERQQLKDRLSDARWFEQDHALFIRVYPHHGMNRQLARVNRLTRAQLDRQMVYLLLERVSESDIVSNRGTLPGGGVGSAKTTKPGHPLSDNNPMRDTMSRVDTYPRTPREEFPEIAWDRLLEEDVQLATVLYNERVAQWRRIVELRSRLADAPSVAAELVRADDSNRLAQHELETFLRTGAFAGVHPIAAKWTKGLGRCTK